VDPTHEQGLMTVERFRWATPRTALVVGIFGLLLTVATFPLVAISHSDTGAAALIPFGIVGYIVARRQPRNPIGWVLLATGVTVMLADDAGSYSVYVYHLGHGNPALGRVAAFLAAAWVSLIVLLPLPIALFPDGVLSRRWRRVLWVYIVDCSALLGIFLWQDISGILARHIVVDSSGQLAVFGGSSTGWEAVVERIVLPVYAVTALLLAARHVLEYRRSTGDRRQQLKWFMTGGTIAVVSLVLMLTINSVAFAGILALPISIGIGILRYRLYEIDRLISRTLSYAIVTGLLVGVYVGMIALTTRLIPLSSSVGVAASTLVAVGLFTPVRRWVQRRVDRRFNRSKYDAEAMVATFTTRLRDAVQLETVRTDLLSVVNAAVEPSQVSLWIRPMSRAS
jgi:hypothetical protein